jgi:3-isopropylmalate/(R)-2-methylmalate dehydratase small subunit
MQDLRRIRIADKAIAVDGNDIDTDRIFPARHMLCVTFEGLGRHAFEDDRKQGHPFDDPARAGARVLLVDRNFGCGSSREHAPWSLTDYGFSAVIAPSFADIFYNNSLKNGLVPVVLSEAQVADLAAKADAAENYELTIDLESQSVTDNQGFEARFEIDEFRKYCLLNGLDDIGLTLQNEAKISEYETERAKSHGFASF